MKKNKILDMLFGEEEKEEYYEESYEEYIPKQKEEKPVEIPRAPKVEKVTSEQTSNVAITKELIKEEMKPEPRRISLDIDDLEEKKSKPITPVNQPTQARRNKMEYEFGPVISPIFGADGKNKTAITPIPVKSTTSKSAVLSPIHGLSQPKKEVPLPTKVLGKQRQQSQSEKEDQGLVNLTLDEILSRTASLSGKETKDESTVHNPSDYEEKKIINSRNMSLFDEE